MKNYKNIKRQADGSVTYKVPAYSPDTGELLMESEKQVPEEQIRFDIENRTKQIAEMQEELVWLKSLLLLEKPNGKQTD